MNDQNASYSDLPSLDDRQAAEQKLDRLFKSFEINAFAYRGRLIDPYLDRAAALWRPRAHEDFATLAVREAEADLEIWFAALLGDRLEDRSSSLMTGRAAFLMCSGPKHFADLFLEPLESLPAAFVAALTDHVQSAVPPSEFGDMHHQPYEAWSPTALVANTLQIEGGMLQGLAGLIRRDERGSGFSWRGIRRTS